MSSTANPVKGETRNQPRKRKESTDDQPLFLKKAFVMISTCPPDIASWSEDGKSFIVKDSERLASEIIPTVYKHNKFSSFVRQLNLYGFRKVRSNSLSNTSDWWVFKHPQFRRDDESAISKIKKSSHFVEPPPNCKDETADMQHQMTNLNSRIVELDNVVAYLIDTLQQQTLANQHQQQQQQFILPMQVNTNNNHYNSFLQQTQTTSPLSISTAAPAPSSNQQQQYQFQSSITDDVTANDHNSSISYDKKRKIKAATGGGGESPKINNMEKQPQSLIQSQQPTFINNSNNGYISIPLSSICVTQQQQSQQASQFMFNNNYVNNSTPSNYVVSHPELYRGDDDDEEDVIDDGFDFDGLFDAADDDDNDANEDAVDEYDYDNINMKTAPVAVLNNESNNNSSSNNMNIDMDHHHVLSAAAVAVNGTASIVPGIDNNRSPHSVTMISSIDTDNTSYLSGRSASASTKTNQLYSSNDGSIDNIKKDSTSLNNSSTKDGVAADDNKNNSISTKTGPLDISNISEIMQVLPKHLQERFIDQLALSIGQNVLSMPMPGGGFDENLIAGKCDSDVINNVSAELDWQIENASVDKCPKAHQQLESSHCFKQQLQNDYSQVAVATTTSTDGMETSDKNIDTETPATVGGVNTANSAVTNKKTMTVGDREITSMGVTTLEEQCPLVALGALLASVRLSTSEATESAVQVFSKSCSNFKQKILKLSNLPAVVNATTSLSTKMLPSAVGTLPQLMNRRSKSSSKKEMMTSSASSSGKSDVELLVVEEEEDISIYSI